MSTAQRTILITGASRGIGRLLAERYAERGERVIAAVRDPEAANLPEGIERHALDAMSEASHDALAAGLDLKSLDLLVCNAGIYRGRGNVLSERISDVDWQDMLMTNVAGPYLAVSAFRDALEAAGGRVTVLSSMMGSSARAPGGSYAYRASKAAATNLVANLAKDLAPAGVAVGAYHPGWVQTDMGGAQAPVTPAESVAGLMREFDALDLARTGCFRSFDGQDIPF